MIKRQPLDYARWGTLAVLVLMIWPVYRGMILYTMTMFRDPLEDMSYGWLVPFGSLYILWHERKTLREESGKPSWRGLLWVCFFSAIAWFGGRGMQSRIEQVSLIGLIWSVPYALWGRRIARVVFFPAMFLAFTIPVSSFVDFFTIHLRVVSTAIAVFLLKGAGIDVQQSGISLFSTVPGSEFSVDVADGCSGIRSLFAIMTLASYYAHFSHGNIIQKWALFMCSLPLAVIGNVCRLFLICIGAGFLGVEAVTGAAHTTLGLIIFLGEAWLIVEINRFLLKKSNLFEKVFLMLCSVHSPKSEEREKGETKTGPSDWLLLFGVLSFGVVLLAAKHIVPPPEIKNIDFVATSLPETVGDCVGDKPWFCHNEQCLMSLEESEIKRKDPGATPPYRCPVCGQELHAISLGEYNKLPKDTMVIKRNYHDRDGGIYSVSVVIGGRMRGSIHRPELCLPAQGFTMAKAERRILEFPAGRPHAVRVITARRPNASSISLVYWFVSRERESSSHAVRIWTDIWDRSIHNRINRWVMMAVNVSPALDTPEELTRFETFLAEFYPSVILKREKK